MRCQLGLFACGLCLLAVFARTAAAQQQISAAEPTSAEIGSLFVRELMFGNDNDCLWALLHGILGKF